MQAVVKRLARSGESIGLVPTMGALHEGHLSLVRRARRENDIVIVSIFVNPTQFGPNEDYLRYPRPFAKDVKLCRAAGVDYVFHPSVKAMFPDGFQNFIAPGPVSLPLCGKFRPGHFRGVATVVAKLFNITLPGRAYFGMKDFQQVRVIETMAEDLNMPVRIVRAPTVRERSGLALSSRNQYLSRPERLASPRIREALQRAGEMLECGREKSLAKIRKTAVSIIKRIPGARIQYFELCDPATLAPLRSRKLPALAAAAVFVGNTRLIDNLLIQK